MVTPAILKSTPVTVLAAFAAVELATRAEITSSIVGVTLAALGGGLTQMRRAESKELTLGQTVAEWGLSGLFGFFVHGLAMGANNTNPWIIWTSCVAAGCAGSAGLAKYLDEKKP